MSWFGNLFSRQNRPRKAAAAGDQLFVLQPNPPPNPAQATPRKARTADQSFPSFQSTASGHRDVRGSQDRFAAVRRRLRDTYTPSQPVTDRRVFAGRSDILTTIIRAIEDDRSHVVIYGHRGIGKTSTLHVLTQAAEEAQYHVIYISCGSSFTFDEVTRVIAAAIPLRYHEYYGPTSVEAESGGTFADLLPAGPINSRFAADLLSHVVGTRLLVCLDEFDRCEITEFRRNVGELLKNLSDRSAPVQFVVAGVASDLAELIDHSPSVQRNILALQMPAMNSTELKELVRNGERLTGLTFDNECLGQVVTIARGLPHLASLLSHYAGLSALEKGRLAVVGGDIATAVATSSAQIGQRTSKRAKVQIVEAQKRGFGPLLDAMAAASLSSSGEPFRIAEVARIAEMPEAACKRGAEEMMANGGLIEAVEDENGKGLAFVEEGVPLLIWLASAPVQAALAAPAAEPEPAPAAPVKQRASS
ncbi:MAG: ATP-binding protein [Proteobacteria bacterium]|nr:ATP-binding protein [Pseudomonadota bacterium]